MESSSGASPSRPLGADPGPLSASQAEERAAALIQAGQLDQAAQLYRQLIAAGQAGPVAYANLAVLSESSAPTAELVALLRQALALQPNFAEAHGNLGLLLLRSGEVGPAIACFQAQIRLRPQAAEGYAHLAMALKEQGDLQASLQASQRALALDPRQLSALSSLGHNLQLLGDPAAAIATYYQRLAFDPNHAETLSNLGISLQAQGDLAYAIGCFSKAVALNPSYPEAHSNLGAALQEAGEFQRAAHHCRAALALRPNFAEAHSNLGNALQSLGDLEGALAAYGQALALRPGFAQAHVNCGMALHCRGDRAGAIAAYQQAIALDPANAGAHANLAMALLAQGDYDQGWIEYQWRWRTGKIQRPALMDRLPAWDPAGPPLAPGEPLLLVCEQGLGDGLQFLRYAPALQQRTGAELLLCVPEPLLELTRLAGLAERVCSLEEAQALETGRWLPLLSVPALLGVTAAQPLVNKPYLRVPEQRRAAWADRLQASLQTSEAAIIGLNWQGAPPTETNILRGRSLPLAEFAPLAKTKGIELVSLQKGAGSEQLKQASFANRFIACQPLVDQTWDFVDTAAIILACDLVITSDTAVAHLAGGLGVPTWLLLHPVPDWRWGLAGTSTAWYPSMRLFRQSPGGSWAEVIRSVKQALGPFLRNRLVRGLPARAPAPPAAWERRK